MGHTRWLILVLRSGVIPGTGESYGMPGVETKGAEDGTCVDLYKSVLSPAQSQALDPSNNKSF